MDEVRIHQSDRLTTMASAEGLSYDELSDQMVTHFADLIGACEIRIRMRDAGLDQLLAVGSIRTAFHTGPTPSRDAAYLDMRAAAEASFFTTCSADRTATAGRPVYGYFYESDEPAFNEPSADPRGLLFSYGPIVVVTVPEVVVDATFTFGDSLMRTDSGRLPSLCPASAATPHHLAHDHHLGDARQIGTSRGVQTPTSAGGSAWEYVEGQIHGDVAIADVDRIVFLNDPDEAPDAMVRRIGRFGSRLDAVGIEWEPRG